MNHNVGYEISPRNNLISIYQYYGLQEKKDVKLPITTLGIKTAWTY